jgi:hypothetical protein
MAQKDQIETRNKAVVQAGFDGLEGRHRQPVRPAGRRRVLDHRRSFGGIEDLS